MGKKSPKRSRGAGRRSGSQISRKVLLALWNLGSSDTLGVLKHLDFPAGLTVGSIWVLLERARLNGLAQRVREGRRFLYSLTANGVRRIEWIKEHTDAGL